MGIKSFWSWWSNSKLQQEIAKQRNQLTNNSIQNKILVNLYAVYGMQFESNEWELDQANRFS